MDWALGAMASTQSVYEGGRVKYLAIARSRRLSSLPNVPTLAEAGGPANVEASGFVVLLTPRNTPIAINERINRDLQAAVDKSGGAGALQDFQLRSRVLDASGTAELWKWDATDLAAHIKRRTISSLEVMVAFHARIDEVNPEAECGRPGRP